MQWQSSTIKMVWVCKCVFIRRAKTAVCVLSRKRRLIKPEVIFYLASRKPRHGRSFFSPIALSFPLQMVS